MSAEDKTDVTEVTRVPLPCGGVCKLYLLKQDFLKALISIQVSYPHIFLGKKKLGRNILFIYFINLNFKKTKQTRKGFNSRVSFFLNLVIHFQIPNTKF